MVIVPDKVLLYFICTFYFYKKHTKGHVPESTDCLELVIVRLYPENTEWSLSLNHNSEGKQIYLQAFESEFVIQLLLKT